MILGDKPLISEVVLSHYRECLSTTRLLLVTYFSRHSHSIVLIHCGVIKVYLKGVFPMQLSFHKIPIRKCTFNVESKDCKAKS
jgi:hypothetical protein